MLMKFANVARSSIMCAAIGLAAVAYVLLLLVAIKALWGALFAQ